MNACATFVRGKHLAFQWYERIYPLVALVFCHFPTPVPLFFCGDYKNVASHFLYRFLFDFIGFCAFLCEDREGEFWECSCPPHFITCPKWWVFGWDFMDKFWSSSSLSTQFCHELNKEKANFLKPSFFPKVWSIKTIVSWYSFQVFHCWWSKGNKLNYFIGQLLKRYIHLWLYISWWSKCR